ncbi:MAG TPA: BTAD domain-containing putative transcriptional regulator, partial [Trueperaceae bacterium]|nr:BTAD domain-containing putative transcriptional regulator [Trueperaceae bacterium]
LPVDKPASLLYYLASRDGWVTRSELAYLYRPDAPEEVALGNVRVILHRARARDWPGELVVEKARVRYAVATDLAGFREATGRGEWEAALRLYRGDFLAGVDLRDAPAYGSWLDAERADLRREWRGAVLREAARLGGHGEHAAAAGWLRRLVRDDPLDEEAVHALLVALFAAGDRQAAAEAYAAFAAALSGELDADPDGETVRLYEALAADAAARPAPPPPAAAPTRAEAASWPRPLTRFVGRREELEALLRLLGRDDVRLVTVHGLGGVGKTRLALEAARRHLRERPAEAWFVPLGGVTTRAGLLAAIADALGMVPGGPRPLEAQVAERLALRGGLLVLDAFEGVAAASVVLSDLLERAPGLKVLVASRAALGLGAETVFTLDGLAAPPVEGAGDPLDYDAVHLFADRAAAQAGGAALGGDDLAAAAELARRVDGLPLALELAAGATRALTVRELLARLDAGVGVLTTDAADVAARHRSLAALLDEATGSLGERERAALPLLALFPAGFTAAAAESVAGVHPPLLLALVEAALVRRTEAGRFVMHELVRRYAADRLGAEERAAFEARYVAYYLELLREQRRSLRGAGHAAARRVLVAEMPNLRHAVELAARADVGAIADAMGPLDAALSYLNLTELGTDLFGRLVQTFEAAGDAVQAARARAGRARMFFGAGRIAEGWELLRAALPVLEAHEAPTLNAALCWASTTTRLLGDLEQARRYAREALERAEQAWSPAEVADALAVLADVHEEAGEAREALAAARRCAAVRRADGDVLAAVEADLKVVRVTLRDLGDVDGAEAVVREAVAEARSLGDDALLGQAVNHASVVAGERGDPEAAEALHREALAAAERLGNVHHVVLGRNNLAGHLQRHGRPDEAHELLLGSLALCRRVGARGALEGTLCLLGENARSRGDHLEAARAFAQAFEDASSVRPVNRSIAQGLSLVARLHADVGDHERAYALSEYLLAEPLTQAPVRKLNAQVVEERRSRLPPARARRVAEEAATWDLGRAVADEVAALAALRRRLERSPRAAATSAPNA